MTSSVTVWFGELIAADCVLIFKAGNVDAIHANLMLAAHDAFSKLMLEPLPEVNGGGNAAPKA